MSSSRPLRFASILAVLAMAFSFVAVDHADARRGGSFGSRGGRTFQSAPATSTSPSTTAPVQRTTTQGTAQSPGVAAQQRPGFLNGFGGSLLRGLAIGGLFGLLLGNGFGGLGGLFGLLFQALLIGGAIMLALRFFRSQGASRPAMAGAGPGRTDRAAYDDRPAGAGLGGLGGRGSSQISGLRIPGLGSRAGAAPKSGGDGVGITKGDFGTFERMLAELQDAYGREDYATLRRLTTPEIMSYLSEELGQNASQGLRNEVSDVRLLQGDLAEAWREGRRDYATVAMRYASRDVTRERATGRVVAGDADAPSETTEVWTFQRDNGGGWLVSAIQDA